MLETTLGEIPAGFSPAQSRLNQWEQDVAVARLSCFSLELPQENFPGLSGKEQEKSPSRWSSINVLKQYLKSLKGFACIEQSLLSNAMTLISFSTRRDPVSRLNGTHHIYCALKLH